MSEMRADALASKRAELKREMEAEREGPLGSRQRRAEDAKWT